MAAFVVVLSEEADEMAPKLEAIAKKHGIKNVPLTIFDGESGPPGYKIAKEADVTVLYWKGLKVQANHALAKGGLDDKTIESIVSSSSSVLK